MTRRALNAAGCAGFAIFVAAGPEILRLASSFQTTSVDPAARPPAIEITYRVSGTASSASVLYANGMNGYNREKTGYDSHGDMKFEKRVTIPAGQHPQISATSNDSGGGSVRVEIWHRGQLIRDAQSSGPFAMADTTAIIR